MSLERVLSFVASKPQIDLYLPDEPDLAKIPKQWIVNVCATILGSEFKDWVQEQVEDRNALMAEKKEIMISMDPHMADKFAASSHVSRKFDPHGIGLIPVFFYSIQRNISQYAQDEQQA